MCASCPRFTTRAGLRSIWRRGRGWLLLQPRSRLCLPLRQHDPNCSPKAKREITLKVTLLPGEDREDMSYIVACTSKLAT